MKVINNLLDAIDEKIYAPSADLLRMIYEKLMSLKVSKNADDFDDNKPLVLDNSELKSVDYGGKFYLGTDSSGNLTNYTYFTDSGGSADTKVYDEDDNFLSTLNLGDQNGEVLRNGENLNNFRWLFINNEKMETYDVSGDYFMGYLNGFSYAYDFFPKDSRDPSGFIRENPPTMGIIEFSRDGSLIDRINEYSEYSTNRSGNFGNGSAYQTNALAREWCIYPTSISPIEIYASGRKYFISTLQKVTIPNTTGLKFIYFSPTTETFEVTDNFDFNYFLDKPITSLIYWEADDVYPVIVADERHGINMDGETHKYLHFENGMVVDKVFENGDGMKLSTLSAGDEKYTSISRGYGNDEDIRLLLNTQIDTPFLCRKNNNGDLTWEIPLLRNNNNSGTSEASQWISPQNTTGNTLWDNNGVLTQVTGNDRIIIYFVATNNRQYPYMKIIGQTLYGTVRIARREIIGSYQTILLDGLPSPEFRPIGAVIVDSAGEVSVPDDEDDPNGLGYVDLRTTCIWEC